jgi:hypothetical protein
MGLIQLAEACVNGKVPFAPGIQQRAHVAQRALHAVADATDGAGRSEDDGKDGLEPSDRVVPLLASHLGQVFKIGQEKRDYSSNLITCLQSFQYCSIHARVHQNLAR